MQFIKILSIWILGLLIPFFVLYLSGTHGYETIGYISVAALYGGFLMLFFGGIIKYGLNKKLDEVVWWVAGVNLLACGFGFGWAFIIGTFVGIALCYQMLRATRHFAQKTEVLHVA